MFTKKPAKSQFAKVLKNQNPTWQNFFKAYFMVEDAEGFHTTRIDVAIDDRNKNPYFTLEQLVYKAERDEYLSFSRKHTVIKDKFEDEHAITLYIGKRGSELLYRFYEKNKQISAKTGWRLKGSPLLNL